MRLLYNPLFYTTLFPAYSLNHHKLNDKLIFVPKQQITNFFNSLNPVIIRLILIL